MSRMPYLLCEALTLYFMTAAIIVGLLYFSGFHFDNGLMTYGLIGLLIALAPMCFTAVTRGSWVGEGTIDRAAPVRPLAMIAPAVTSVLQTRDVPVIGGRRSFQILYSNDDVDSIEVTDRLARHLADIGIAHSHLGGIHAHDGSAEWRLEPVLGERRLEGWVSAAERGGQASVITAITDFLKRDLDLDTEVRQ